MSATLQPLAAESMERPVAVADSPEGKRIFDLLVAVSSADANLDPAWLKGIDWHELLLQARHHSLSAHLGHRLLQSRLDLPSMLRSRLKSEFQANLHRNFAFLNETRRILLAWDGQGITGMPYKGPVLAEQLWDSFALRECSDIDLLVDRVDVVRAGRVLADLGYRPVSTVEDHLRSRFLRNASEEQFRHKETDILLELQWAPVPRTFAVSFNEAAIWNSATRLRVAEQTLLTPAPAVLLGMLAIHGWKHNWSKLIWIADVAALVRRYDLDWGALQASAKEQGWRRILALALEMARRIYGSQTPVPADDGIAALADDLERDLRMARVIEYMDWHRYMLRARDSFMDRAAQLVNFSLTPGLAEYRSLCLPRWATPGYRAVRVARVLSLWPEKALT